MTKRCIGLSLNEFRIKQRINLAPLHPTNEIVFRSSDHVFYRNEGRQYVCPEIRPKTLNLFGLEGRGKGTRTKSQLLLEFMVINLLTPCLQKPKFISSCVNVSQKTNENDHI